MKDKFIDFFFDEDMKDSKYASIVYYLFVALFIETIVITLLNFVL